MRKSLFSGLFFILILTGCSNKAYNNVSQKGLDYIESEDFEKAEAAFELALDEKKQDVKATALLEQVRNYQEALVALEEGDLDFTVEMVEKVTNETEGSEALIKKAEELLSLVEDLKTALAELTEKYESVVKQFKAKKYEDANKSINKLLKGDLSHSYFQSIKKDIGKLQNDIEVAIIAKEKAEKEAAEQAAAEEAKKQNETNIKLTGEDAMAIVKSLGDWPLSTTFELNPSVIELDGIYYYGIYVNTHVDASLSSRVNYLIDANNGKVYDNSRGELAPLD